MRIWGRSPCPELRRISEIGREEAIVVADLGRASVKPALARASRIRWR
jgi:hypothetical protein